MNGEAEGKINGSHRPPEKECVESHDAFKMHSAVFFVHQCVLHFRARPGHLDSLGTGFDAVEDSATAARTLAAVPLLPTVVGWYSR